MKILLTNPPVKKVNEKNYDLPDFPNISLAYLAGYLEGKNINFEVIDTKLKRYNSEKFINLITAKKYDIIGLTAFTHEINYTHYLARQIRERLKNVIIVIGGPHATAVKEQILEEFKHFNLAVIGEGETILYKLLKALESNIPLSEVRGIAYRDTDGNLRVTPAAERIKNLDSMSDPAFHLFPEATVYHIITSRGCPFKCVFCSRQHGQTPRFLSVNRTVNLFEKLVRKTNIKYLIFADENFSIDRRRTDLILDSIIEKGLNNIIEWEIQTHISLIDVQLLKKLYQAGCRHICFGIETGNKDILKHLGKHIDLTRAAKIVREANQLGFRTELNCILGHPNETRKTALDTINFVTNLKPYLPIFGIMIPYPDTEVARMAKNRTNGYVYISNKWDDYNKQLGTALELENLTILDLKLLQFYGYTKVFLFSNRYLDFLKFCIRYWREALAFIKNLINILIPTCPK